MVCFVGALGAAESILRHSSGVRSAMTSMGQVVKGLFRISKVDGKTVSHCYHLQF